MARKLYICLNQRAQHLILIEESSYNTRTYCPKCRPKLYRLKPAALNSHDIGDKKIFDKNGNEVAHSNLPIDIIDPIESFSSDEDKRKSHIAKRRSNYMDEFDPIESFSSDEDKRKPHIAKRRSNYMDEFDPIESFSSDEDRKKPNPKRKQNLIAGEQKAPQSKIPRLPNPPHLTERVLSPLKHLPKRSPSPTRNIGQIGSSHSSYPQSPKLLSSSMSNPYSLSPELFSLPSSPVHQLPQYSESHSVANNLAHPNQIKPNGYETDDERNSDTAWYIEDEVNLLLNHYQQHQNADIEILQAVMGQHNQGIGGRELAGLLCEYILQRHRGFTVTTQRVFIPVNLGNLHWVAVCLVFDDIHRDQLNHIDYFDPLGDDLDQEVYLALVESLANDIPIVPSRYRYQLDGYNCGPWIVQWFRHLLQNNNGFPNPVTNINTARREQRTVPGMQALLQRAERERLLNERRRKSKKLPPQSKNSPRASQLNTSALNVNPDELNDFPPSPTVNRYKRRLLIGEADFSYAVALLKKHEKNRPGLGRYITATEYMGLKALETAYEKESEEAHRKFVENIQYLRDQQATEVLFEVDARKLTTHPQINQQHFKRIHFNFPHDKSSYQQRTLPKMLAEFFQQVAQLQQAGDRVYIALPKERDDYKEKFRLGYIYGIFDAAAQAGYKLVAKRAFGPKRYPGYEHRITGKSTSAPVAEEAREYVFEKTNLDYASIVRISNPRIHHIGGNINETVNVLPLLDTDDESSSYSESSGSEKEDRPNVPKNNKKAPTNTKPAFPIQTSKTLTSKVTITSSSGIDDHPSSTGPFIPTFGTNRAPSNRAPIMPPIINTKNPSVKKTSTPAIRGTINRPNVPKCPLCGADMERRQPGLIPFYGCSRYRSHGCRGQRDI